MQNEGGPGQPGGGVKAMLNKIKEQFRDSHVQLPDGTIPKGKINITKKTSKEPIPRSQPATAETPKGAGGQGVKAKLAELNAKYSNSYVQFPDGSVPSSSSTSKKMVVRSDKEDRVVQEPIVPDIPSTLSIQSETNTIFPDNTLEKKSADQGSNGTRIYSDYETIEEAISTGDDKLQYPGRSIATPVASAAAVSAVYHQPPALLDRNKGTRPASQVQEEPLRLISTPRQVMSDNSRIIERQQQTPTVTVPVKTHTTQSQIPGALHTPTYGIGVSFKPDEGGFLEVVKFIPGGPGAQSGRVNIGDKLRMINDTDITKISIDEFPGIISGPIDSSVKLSLMRRREGGGHTLIHVTLTRGPCGSPNGSGPRVLVPKVIPVNPVHLVGNEPLAGTQSSSSTRYASSGADVGSVESARQSPSRRSEASAVTDRVGLSSTNAHISEESVTMTTSRAKGFIPVTYRHGIVHQRTPGPAIQSPAHVSESMVSTPAGSRMPVSNPGMMSAPSSERIGVGIVFLNDERGALQVQRLEEGGPAHASGAVYRGDVLVEVNGRDVRGRSAADIQQEIAGPWNSTVVLGFGRHRPGFADSLHRVQLARLWGQQHQDTPSRLLCESRSSLGH